MKRIVFNPGTSTICAEKVKGDALVGIIINTNKHLVVKKKSPSGTPFLLLNDHLKIDVASYSSMNNLLEDHEGNEAFQFDTEAEMYKWFTN